MFTEIGDDGIDLPELPCITFLRSRCHVITGVLCPDSGLVEVVHLPEDSGLSPYHIELASDWLESLGLSERKNQLSRDDLIQCLQALGHCPNLEYLEQMLEELSIVEREEYSFGDLCFLWNRFIQSHDEELRLLEKAFQFFDKDQNGSLSVDEFRTANRELGNLLTDDEIKMFVELVDVTNDGDIQYEELLASLMSQYDLVSKQINSRGEGQTGPSGELPTERLLREQSRFSADPPQAETAPTHQEVMKRRSQESTTEDTSSVAVGLPNGLQEIEDPTSQDSPILKSRCSSTHNHVRDHSNAESL